MVNELIEVINTIGFPMAMVVYFIWDKSKSADKMVDNLKETLSIMSNTINANTECLSKNTLILEKLLTKLSLEELENE